MKVSESVEIMAAPAHIWPFLIDPEKVLQWCITFKKFKYTGDQRSGKGTPLYIEEDPGNGLTKMQFVVQDWRENEELGLRMIGGASYKSYDLHMSLEPCDGGSRFTFGEEVVLPYGILGQLIGLIAQRMSARTLHTVLGKLKALAEA